MRDRVLFVGPKTPDQVAMWLGRLTFLSRHQIGAGSWN